MNTYEFDSIGTHWSIELLDDTQFDDGLIAKIRHTAEQFTQRYSRFRDDSLVAQLQRNGRLAHPPTEMITMLEFAREMYNASNGAFDIAVGNDLHNMGYGKRAFGRETSPHSVWNELVVTPAEMMLPSKIMLDFGGFGKGWLIDEFARVLQFAGKQYFIVNGGGDLYVQAKYPVKFYLENPHDPTVPLGEINIQRGALAGSDTIKRTWNDGETLKHHIIDPTTHDSSATGVVASFVAANTALIADTMATILILRPDLRDELSRAYQLKTMLVSPDLTTQTLR